MANQAIWVYTTAVTGETDGAAVANAAFASAPDASITSGNHLNYPLADITLYVAGFGAALSGWQQINLYRNDQNIAGSTYDAVVPAATNPQTYVGSFRMISSQATNTTGYFHLTDVPLCESQYFYIENATGTTLSTGWGLTVRPKTYGPSA